MISRMVKVMIAFMSSSFVRLSRMASVYPGINGAGSVESFALMRPARIMEPVLFNRRIMIVKSNLNTTAEQLLAMPGDGNRYELLNGVLIMMSPAGSEHGWIAERMSRRLGDHVEKQQPGRTYAAETGFRISINPDTVRAPDAAFVSDARLKRVEPTSGYLPLAPDLLVEVVSPNDTSSEVEAKAQHWISAGTAIVLVADPANQTIRVYKNESDIHVLRRGDTFDSGDVCGNWKLSVDDAFGINDTGEQTQIA